MAHWHDFNPWADTLIYVPDLEELLYAVFNDRYEVTNYYRFMRTNCKHNKLDAYLLTGGGEIHAGIRYGKKGEQYFSPHVNLKNKPAVRALAQKYGPR